jgi:PKD repeat protein
MSEYNKIVIAVLLVIAVSQVCLVSAASDNCINPTQGIMSAASFEKISENGFGDPQNNYAWSIAEFKGDVYVGTGRNIPYFVALGMKSRGTFNDTMTFPFLTHPGGAPPPPFVVANQSPPSKADVMTWSDDMRAEIWRYHEGRWERVHQASTFINPSNGYTYPEGVGYRIMTTFNDTGGTEALYTGVGFGFGPVIIIKSTDGIIWVPVNTRSIPSKDTRAMISHAGRLYMGTADGIYASGNPSQDTDTWQKVANFQVASLKSYNGYLYAGTGNPSGPSETNGFEVWKSTTVSPAGPGDWVRVVPGGAGDAWNVLAATMETYNGDLYVGSMNLPFATGTNGTKGFDLVRINTEDQWELIVGNYQPTLPTVPRDPPLSRLPSGFGNPLNLYAWSMEEYHGTLYLGTFDIGSLGQYLGEMSTNISPYISNQDLATTAGYLGGADMWKSNDGTSWVPVDLNGLGNPNNYGLRTMLASPEGFYVGTANPEEGCEIWIVPTPVKPLLRLPGFTIVPTDPDGDGLFEDVNGDGTTGFLDVIAYFENLVWISENEPIAAFDYNIDGAANFLDVIELFRQIPEI